MEKITAIIRRLKEVFSYEQFIAMEGFYHSINRSTVGLFEGEIISCVWNKEQPHFDIDIIAKNNQILSKKYSFYDFVCDETSTVLEHLEDTILTSRLKKSSETNNVVPIVTDCLGEIASSVRSYENSDYGNCADILMNFIKSIRKEVLQENSNTILTKDSSNKIKWLGSVNTLTTLFNQLLYGDNNLGLQLIDCSIDDVRKLILNNFVDKEGLPFPLNTINTYTDKNKKDEKQAKKQVVRIPDDNIVPVEEVKKIRRKITTSATIYPAPKNLPDDKRSD